MDDHKFLDVESYISFLAISKIKIIFEIVNPYNKQL